MGGMKNLYTIGFDDTTLNLVAKARNLLAGDYVWSSDLNKIKPLLIEILDKKDETSIKLAQIIMRTNA